MLTHEIKTITRMVQLGNVGKYQHIIHPEYFSDGNREIYEALLTYETQYGVCMDEPTFLDQFPDFTWTPSDVQVEYLADELQQSYIEGRVIKLLQDGQETVADNPRIIAKAILDDLNKIVIQHGTITARGRALLAGGIERIEDIRKVRFEKDSSLPGVTSGFSLLDEVCLGTKPGEVEIWVARPGKGKSMCLAYSLLKAWESGKRVSLLSPEMTEKEWGVRTDAFVHHASMMQMLSGRMSDDEIDFLEERQRALVESITQDIVFREPFDMGRNFTTADVRNAIEADKPDIIGIDGLLLLEPMKPYRDTRERVSNVISELKRIVMETNVPMRLAHQVNRESEKNRKAKKDNEIDEILPQLHHLAESGATEQFASRVISLSYEDAAKTLYLAVRKNRNGPPGRIIKATCNIDIGLIKDERIYSADDDPVQEEMEDVTRAF